MTSKTIAKIAAILAGAGLILSSFAYAIPAGAQTTVTTTTTTTSSVTFTRDLTIGSTGADVTALQTWLISKGYSIPAGATGYFGMQTQAAVAAYQTASGITPALGYFGPITRARVNASIVIPTPAPQPQPDEDEDDDEDDEQDEAEEAVDNAQDALDDARDEVEEADEDGEDVDNAEDLLDDAEEQIDEANEALDDEDWREALNRSEEAEELIDEALEEIDSDDDDDDDNKVSTSAEVNDRSGSDNDIATFEIEIELNAFNQDAFIAQDPDVSIEYEIQDADGDEVVGATSISEVLRSSADEEGDYFFFEENEEETLTLTVAFDPLAADEGEFYRVQLETINFNDEEDSPDQEWTASPASRYRTDYVHIAD